MPQLSRFQFILGVAAAITIGASVDASACRQAQGRHPHSGLANDGSFNQVALEGVKKLAKEGLITFEIREKQKDPATSEPVIRQYAQKGYDLIIGMASNCPSRS